MCRDTGQMLGSLTIDLLNQKWVVLGNGDRLVVHDRCACMPLNAEVSHRDRV